MTVPEKRLDAATDALTARERAILILRPWIAGGEGDDRLRKHMPAEQKAEVARIEKAINEYNQYLFQTLSYVVEWLWNADVELAWLECLDGFVKRENASRGHHSLPALPSPGRAFTRDLPMLFGQLVVDDDERPPSNWDEARAWLAHDIGRTLKLRWGEYVAWHQVRAELEEIMGEEMQHLELREHIETIGRKVKEMHAVLEGLVGEVELGPPTDEQLGVARSHLHDWDALKPGPPPGHAIGRPWMPREELADLEALETRLAAELRAKKN